MKPNKLGIGIDKNISNNKLKNVIDIWESKLFSGVTYFNRFINNNVHGIKIKKNEKLS